MKESRQSDVPVAVVVAVVDLVIMAMLASSYVLSGLSIGAPDARDVHQRDTYQHDILVITTLFAGGGCALAALFRFWKTSITHLVVTGLPLLACIAWRSWS
ncbi:hypothetical protein ACH4FX_33120 [Streptomyces sp. NPDC018019]|uniref:hypothetical protein n=1 Tax=Streptomyces sp. NPDC018019 TaxID=3365030 RepID=UPI0037A3AB3E